jgi:CheY-like chemotaxis protein
MARILVVDDQATDPALMKKILEHVGHTVSEASDGVDGLAAVMIFPR